MYLISWEPQNNQENKSITNSRQGKILAWEYPSGERKLGLDTVYPSAKINYVTEFSMNDKTTKIDIYAID
jgi:hypothetical protein